MIVFLIKTKRPLLPFPDALQLALPFYIPLMLQHRYIIKLYFIHKRLTALTVKEKKLQQKDLVLQQGSGIAVNAPGALNECVTSDLVNNRRAEVKAIQLFLGEKLIGRWKLRLIFKVAPVSEFLLPVTELTVLLIGSNLLLCDETSM